MTVLHARKHECNCQYGGTSRTLAGSTAYIVEAEKTVMIFDHQGTLIAQYPWPKPGTKYVASGQRPGRKPKTI